MTYSSTYDPNRYTSISQAIRSIENMRSGGRIVIDGLEREVIGRMRYLLYDWMSHLGIKKSYRIRSDPHRGEITILHLGMSDTMNIREDVPNTEVENLVGELIGIENPEDIVEQWIKEKRTNIIGGAEILRRLGEILS